MEWTLDIVLIALLVATLLQAMRLERALGAMKRDRTSLEALIAGFNASTHQAESGIQRLRSAADGAGRIMETQIAKSASLKDDLVYLTERGERLADRLDGQIRTAEPIGSVGRIKEDVATPPPPAAKPRAMVPAGASPAEQELLAALRLAR